MKKAILLLVVLALFGLYRGWFTYTTGKTEDDKTKVDVVVDTDALREDEEIAVRKLKEVGEKILSNAGKGRRSTRRN